ncbi:MAG: PQQ-binding-like beta-propeller repeat protein [Candidatus Bathyarchaeota archaeon]|nr:PQQ-binding-like beta-propeller repeat protein [Candidatus Bathyarchaeota archaeon]
MSNRFSNAKIGLVTLFLLLTMTVAIVAVPASAHDPTWNIPTYAYITAAPDPIGVNQPVSLIFWLDKVPPTAAGVGGDRWANLTISVTAPDGSKETLGPFVSDPVGGGYAFYTPTQTGTYTFVFNFPGQVASLYNPETGIPGDTARNGAYIGDYYEASTWTTTLDVQSDQVITTDFGLPTSYWIRPIEGQNTNWATIASNYLAGAAINYHYQPDGTAPNTGHVMWTKVFQAGGVVGGSNVGIQGMTFYDGTNYENKFGDVIILNGKVYYSLPQSNNAKDKYTCVDLATGETVWTRDDMSPLPSFAQLYDYESMNQHGVIPDGYLWGTTGGGRFAASGTQNLTAYDPADGSKLFTLLNVPGGTECIGSNGEILRYVLDGSSLALWNNTAAHDLTGSTDPNDWTSTSYNQWRPVGKTIDASTSYSWNITLPTLPAGSSIATVLPDDKIIFQTSLSAGTYLGTPEVTTLTAVSLKPANRGTIVWTADIPALPGNASRSLSAIDYDSHVMIYFSKETISYTGYSMDTGDKLWGPTASENAFNFYSGGGGSISTVSAGDGKLYSTGYSGIVTCYDDITGDILWIYNNYAGLDAPYTGYPTGIAGVADGKVYIAVNEHSCGAPYWKGAEVVCIDATNGEKLWGLYAHGSSSYGDAGFAIADGMLVYLNLYDMQIYCVGKGPSATTVDAPMTALIEGQSLLIRGTVTDTSAGAKLLVEKSLFNTVPAVSDESVDDWMEYLYMQKAIPTDVVGVSVHLTAIDPNGNFQDIGTTTADINGKYGITWTPPVPGTYHVTATFEGSDSYWGSQDTTYFVVDPAVAAQPITSIAPLPSSAPTQTAASPSALTPVQSVSPLPSEVPQPSTTAATPTLTYIAIGAAVIVIVAAAAALILRKRK